jgi:hypothetical protein
MIIRIVGGVLIALACVWPIQAKSFEDHVRESYRETVLRVEESGIRGEMAREITQYALVRQIHEDGTDRSCDWSVPGIGTGGWNSEILHLTVKRLNPVIVLNHCYDSEGMRLYTLKGDKANVVSATIIANLFDLYPSRLPNSFSARQRDLWRVSRAYSYLLSCHLIEEIKIGFKEMEWERVEIIRRCNRMYGPGSDRIEGEVKKLQPVFREVLNEN